MGFLALIPWRAWAAFGVAAIVAVLIGLAWNWVASKDRAIHRAQTQRTVAVVAFARSETDLVMAHVNLAGARHEIDVQNTALGFERQRATETAQALARSRQEADRAAAATDRRISAIRAQEAALRARRPVCDGALDLIRGNHAR